MNRVFFAFLPLALVICVGTSASSTPVQDETPCSRLVVRVDDPYGGAGAGITMILTRASDVDKIASKYVTVNGDGRCDFGCVTPGFYRLENTPGAFPGRRIEIEITAGAPAEIKFLVGVPCVDETGPPIELSVEDEAAILADLLDRALNYPGATVLLDENIKPLKATRRIPRKVVIRSLHDLKRARRLGTATYVRLAPLEVRGGCVVANYHIGCVRNGVVCNLCCEGWTYTYRKEAAGWKGKMFMGYISDGDATPDREAQALATTQRGEIRPGREPKIPRRFSRWARPVRVMDGNGASVDARLVRVSLRSWDVTHGVPAPVLCSSMVTGKPNIMQTRNPSGRNNFPVHPRLPARAAKTAPIRRFQ